MSDPPAHRRFLSAWLLAALAVLSGCKSGNEPRSEAPLAHQVYVWQRAWTDGVKSAVRTHAPRFERLIVLAAELSFEGDRIVVATADVDFAALPSRAVGLALRVGPRPGGIRAGDAAARRILEVARAALQRAREQRVEVAELQLDYDAPTRLVGAYAAWVKALAGELPVPVTVTALPAWMDSPEFAQLASAAAGFVLQVHSLQRPRGPNDAFTLCAPPAVKGWLRRAAAYRRPFRVALPTYGYELAFDPDGKLLGLSAEAPARQLPAGTIRRVVRAEAGAMSGLVRWLKSERPAGLASIVWYRLPVRDDLFNWRWTTLEAVMAGKQVAPAVTVRAVATASGLYDVELRNEGDADAEGPFAVRVRWPEARDPLAADGVGGFHFREHGAGEARLESGRGPSQDWLAPGDARRIGWLRFEAATSLTTEIATK